MGDGRILGVGRRLKRLRSAKKNPGLQDAPDDITVGQATFHHT